MRGRGEDGRERAGRRRRGWGTRRRLAAAGALVVLLLAAVAARQPAQEWLLAAGFASDSIFRLPGRPLTWFTGDPSTRPLAYGEDGRGLLTLPAGGGSAPGLVLSLGADPAEAGDERVARLTDGLARVGFAVLLALSPDLDDALVLPSEIPRLTAAFEALEAHPRVRGRPVGYAGLSAGGSLAIVAASQPAIAGRVAFVVALGPYDDAASLAAAVLSSSYRGPAGVEAWTPAAISRRAVRGTLLASLPEREHELARAVLDGSPRLEDVEALLAALGPERRAALEAVSPRYHAGGLRAPLYLLHDRRDAFVPWTESEALAARREPAVYHRLDIFEHVEPRPGNLRHALRDGWRLLRLLRRVIADAG